MVGRNFNAEPSTEHTPANVHSGQRMFVAECRIWWRAPDLLYGDPWNPQEYKKPNLEGWAKCNKCKKIFWLPDLGSNQGPTD